MKKPIVLILLLIVVVGTVIVGFYIKHQNDVNAEKARLAEQAKIAEETKIAEQKKLHDEYELGFRAVVAEIIFQAGVNNVVCERIAFSWEIGTGAGSAMSLFVRLAQDKAKKAGIYDLTMKGKEKIENEIRKLANPPSDYKTGYDLLLEMYGYHVQLYNQATSPAGSYVFYCKDVNDKYSEIQKTYNKILVVVPGIKDESEKRALDLERIREKIKNT